MSTTVVSKIANPFASGGSMTYPSGTGIPQVSGGAAWGSTLSTTGTGNVVLSDSPTLTGNVNANVNLRTGTLSSLLALPGGVSEIGYASDVDTLVKFNGVGGQAEVYGKQGYGTTLNYVLTNANCTNVIDCNNVSYLYINTDPSFTTVLTNLNIKLPATSVANGITSLTIVFGYNYAGWGSSLTFTLSYQAIDIANFANVYYPIPADGSTTNVAKLNYSFSSSYSFIPTGTVQFVASSYADGWTRLPMPHEAVLNGKNTSNLTGAKGESISSNVSTGSLTSGTVTAAGLITLTAGTWLITGYVKYTTSVGFTASVLSVCPLLSSTSISPSAGGGNGTTIQVPTTTGTIISLPLATQILTTNAASTAFQNYYTNVLATFSAGTVSANVTTFATRLF